jgi:hypothetical protein
MRTWMSLSDRQPCSLEQPLRACIKAASMVMSDALSRPTIGTKELSSLSTARTRLQKLEDGAAAGLGEAWGGAAETRYFV